MSTLYVKYVTKDLRVRSLVDTKKRNQSSIDIKIGSSKEETITLGTHTLPQSRLCAELPKL